MDCAGVSLSCEGGLNELVFLWTTDLVGSGEGGQSRGGICIVLIEMELVGTAVEILDTEVATSSMDGHGINAVVGGDINLVKEVIDGVGARFGEPYTDGVGIAGGL